MSDITTYLFETNAFVVAPADEPFWYTSGLFGPYYINTHFLYGSKEEAEELLGVIEEASAVDKRHQISRLVGAKTKAQYEQHAIYRDVIDRLVALAQTKPYAYVSGGERRDFFFSIEVARKLDLPHLYIFKDQEVWLAETSEKEAKRATALKGNVLHVADLITKASSYERAWIPALKAHGLTMTDTLAGVDRAQGGVQILQTLGVEANTLATIDKTLFREAKSLAKIDRDQEIALNRYVKDERAFVTEFLATHVGFLAKEEKKDRKTKERVERLRKLLADD